MKINDHDVHVLVMTLSDSLRAGGFRVPYDERAALLAKILASDDAGLIVREESKDDK